MLTDAVATVTAIGRDTLTVSGLAAETVVTLLSSGGVPFSEVSAHRATLEEAYMELTLTRSSSAPRHRRRRDDQWHHHTGPRRRTGGA